MSAINPLLSIVIVAWKSSEEIEACVRSLPRTLFNREVEAVVVDNSQNEDGSQGRVRNAAPWVRYLNPGANLGFGKANNLGYRLTTGENVLFLNPDTICCSQALAHCVHRLESESAVGLISPRLVQADGSLDAACRRSIPSLWDGFCRASGLAARFPQVKLFSGYNLSYLPESGTYDVGAINGAFMMGRRAVFEKVGVFDETYFMYGDDLDLCLRIAKAGYRIVYDGSVQIVHLKGRSVAKDYEAMSAAIFDANRDVYLKHFNPHNSRLVTFKYRLAFGLWKRVAQARAKLNGRRRVRP